MFIKMNMDVMPLVTNEDLVKLPHSVILTRECIKVLRYNGDNATAHDTLRIQPNLT
jgi:hypothetical protein